METLLENDPAKRPRLNMGFLAGVVIAIAILSAALWLISRRPSVEDQMAEVLASAEHEGSPEFERLRKDVIISTDRNTVESPTGLGRVSMYIKGNIFNKGNETFEVVEVNVAVVDPFNTVLKEKRVLVVPVQQADLGPGETIPITLALEGFERNDDRANIRWKVTALKAAKK